MSQGTKTKGSQLPHEVRFKDKVCNICALNLLVLLSCALTLSQILTNEKSTVSLKVTVRFIWSRITTTSWTEPEKEEGSQ